MKYDTLLAFSGMNLHTAPQLIGKGEVSFTKNLSSKKIGIFTKTGDYEIKNAQITNDHSILGGVDFQRADGTHTHVVACNGASNADIYIDVTGTWTAQSQALSAGKQIMFAFSPALDTLFAVNETDDTRSYDGSSWSTVTNVTDAPKGKVIVSFGDRLHILNATVGTDTFSTRSYRSSTVETGSITWNTTDDWFTFDDSIITAGKVGDNLMILCKNSSHILTLGDEKYQIGKIGGVSIGGIAEYDDYGFFASYHGVYASNGSTPQKVSLPIQELWDNIPYANLANIQMAINNDYLYVYIGDLTVPETINNCLLEYDINQNDWNIIELGTECKQLYNCVTTLGKKLFMGDDDGNIFQMFTSNSQNTSTFGSVMETEWTYGTDPKYIDDFKELWLHGKDISSLSVSIKLDNDSSRWIPIGEFNGPTSVIKFSHRAGRVKFRLQESGSGNLYEIHTLEIGYDPGFIK
jgi:hypothetical protein